MNNADRPVSFPAPSRAVISGMPPSADTDTPLNWKSICRDSSGGGRSKRIAVIAFLSKSMLSLADSIVPALAWPISHVRAGAPIMLGQTRNSESSGILPAETPRRICGPLTQSKAPAAAAATSGPTSSMRPMSKRLSSRKRCPSRLALSSASSFSFGRSAAMPPGLARPSATFQPSSGRGGACSAPSITNCVSPAKNWKGLTTMRWLAASQRNAPEISSKNNGS
ncbi:MAG: hypothetical protein V9G24_17770 [Rhodoblastus sp.]